MPVGEEPHDWLKQMGGDSPLLFHICQAVSPNATRIGLAVSGGSDSLALLHLFAQAAPHLGLNLHAVTVDHALRPEARAEAAEVARICAGLGVAHDTLRWDHGRIAGNLQDQARRARYALIADWARQQRLATVMVGHTADDQAETFLMGLSRAAGLDGLTGMRRHWRDQGVQFQRPLLGLKRDDLRLYLTRKGVQWIEDPSNENDRFTRVKARRALKALEPLGITVGRLGETIAHLAQAQAGIQVATVAAWAGIGREQAGALHVDWQAFFSLAPEIQRRILLGAIDWLASDIYAPRGSKVVTLQRALALGQEATLNGCRFRIKNQTLSIYREPRAVKSIECATTEVWDRRWQMTGPHAPDLTIRALGAAGLSALKDWRATGIARDALLVSPAIWRKDALIAAPLAGFSQEWQAKLCVSLNECILSH